jgi:hypothetical protein
LNANSSVTKPKQEVAKDGFTVPPDLWARMGGELKWRTHQELNLKPETF